jgi:hypothetical protein
MVRPDFVKAVVGSLNFGHFPEFPAWAPDDAVKHRMLTMATTFGYVDGSVMAYVVYSGWVGLHKWGLNSHKEIEAIRAHAFSRDQLDYLPEDASSVNRLRQLCAPLRWDVSMGAVVLFIVTAAFMLSGAAVLMPLQSRFDGWSLLTNQAHVWRTIHPTLVWTYYVCVIAALWGSLQALPEIYARVTQEIVSVDLAGTHLVLRDDQEDGLPLHLQRHHDPRLAQHPVQHADPDCRLSVRQLRHCFDHARRPLPQFQTAGSLPDALAGAGWLGPVVGNPRGFRGDQRLGASPQAVGAGMTVGLDLPGSLPAKV